MGDARPSRRTAAGPVIPPERIEQAIYCQFKVVFDAIRQLMAPPATPAKPPIGFDSEAQKSKVDAKRARIVRGR